jgi:hypothetical protein
MLMQQLLALKPAQVVEQTLEERYEESADWDADMEKLQGHLKAALAIMDSPNWAKHIDDTEKNFDVDGLRSTHDSLYDAVDEANTLAKDFYSAMEDAA